MAYVRKKGEKDRFYVVDNRCLGCSCFQPGHYQHRGATGGGSSRNTGQVTPTCMQNAYRGCPADTGYTKEREAERKREGWKNV